MILFQIIAINKEIWKSRYLNILDFHDIIMAKEIENEETEREESKQNISVKGVRKDIYGKILKLTRDTGPFRS
jgi:hypothetical protein